MMKNYPLGFAVVLQLVACATESATSSNDEGASGFSRSRSVASLDDERAARPCDWSLETQGGAGKVTACAETSSRVVHTKEECLEDIALVRRLADCYAVTVGELEDWSTDERADPCGDSSRCEALEERLEKCDGTD